MTSFDKGTNDNCFYCSSDGIYATTVHELTHAGHRELDPGMFSVLHGKNCERLMLRESWALGVETIVTNDRYLNLYSNYKASNRIGSTMPLNLYNSFKQDDEIINGSNEEYTPIVIDLVDNFNQRQEFNNSTLPIDRVRGYTLKQIQTSLNNSRGPHTWKERLKSQHSNPTKNYVDELFGVYMFDNCK